MNVEHDEMRYDNFFFNISTKNIEKLTLSRYKIGSIHARIEMVRGSD